VALLGLWPGPAAAQGSPETNVPICKTDLTPQLRAMVVPGLSAAIVKGDRIVCTAAAGLANIDEDRPVTPDTLFLVASVSKTVTATAIMQLYEQGKFGLDDDVNDYLPYRISIPASPDLPITFRQLLTHTSSIADNWSTIDSLLTKGEDSPLALADFTRGYLTPDGPYYNKDANFESGEPGTVSSYSNMGAVLLGYLVEVISGVPFDQYCRDHILAPLGMTATTWRLAGIDRSRLAMPYRTRRSRFSAIGQYGEPDYPDGMLRTSVVELARFMIAYLQGGSLNGATILKPNTIAQMLTPQTGLDPSQGLIWFRDDYGDREVWGHDGSDIGAGAEIWFDPKTKTGVILMTNGAWNKQGDLISTLFREADTYD
jgi:CubicO group peptidase (beta-lactamase class C family)